MSNRNPKYQMLISTFQNSNFKLQARNIEKGFTLIEVMVAVAVLAISIVTIMQLFSGGLRSSKISKDYTRAVIHAKEKMEEIILKPASGSGEFSAESSNKNRFRWEAEVVPYSELSLTGLGSETKPLDLLKIKIKVLWTDSDKQKSVELTTLKLNPPEADNIK